MGKWLTLYDVSIIHVELNVTGDLCLIDFFSVNTSKMDMYFFKTIFVT